MELGVFRFESPSLMLNEVLAAELKELAITASRPMDCEFSLIPVQFKTKMGHVIVYLKPTVRLLGF